MKTEKKLSCSVEKHEPIPEEKKKSTLFRRLDILTGTVLGRAMVVRRQFYLEIILKARHKYSLYISSTTARRMVPAYTNCDIQLQTFLLMMD